MRCAGGPKPVCGYPDPTDFLVLSTTAIAASTFQGRPAVESNQWDYVYNDECQISASREAGLLVHALREDAQIINTGDGEQITPHETPPCRNTELGQVCRDTMAGSWAMKDLPPSTIYGFFEALLRKVPEANRVAAAGLDPSQAIPVDRIAYVIATSHALFGGATEAEAFHMVTTQLPSVSILFCNRLHET